MLVEDNPTFANWDQDETAIAESYAESDPEVVADEIEAAALAFVNRLRSLQPEQLERRGRRSDGSEFTVASLSRYFLHDVIHHLWDVTGQQDATSSWNRAIPSTPSGSRRRASALPAPSCTTTSWWPSAQSSPMNSNPHPSVLCVTSGSIRGEPPAP